MGTSTKRCRTCDEDKPLHAFSSHPKTPDGYCHTCRACRRMHSRGVPEPLPRYPIKPHPSRYAELAALERIADVLDAAVAVKRLLVSL